MTPENARFWKSRRVLVTGGGGLVAGWLARRLLQLEAEVYVLTRPNGRLSPALDVDRAAKAALRSVASPSLCDLAALNALIAENAIRSIFHMAADNTNRLGDRSPYALLESNIRATYTVLEAGRQCGCGEILLSSSHEATRALANPAQAFNPYAASKLCVEHLARSFRESYGMKLVTIRPDNVFGGGDLNANRLIPWLILERLRDRDPQLSLPDGAKRRYLYVETLVDEMLGLVSRLDGDPVPTDVVDIDGLAARAPAAIRDMVLACFAGASGGGDADPLYAAIGRTVEWYVAHREYVLGRLGEPTS